MRIRKVRSFRALKFLFSTYDNLKWAIWKLIKLTKATNEGCTMTFERLSLKLLITRYSSDIIRKFVSNSFVPLYVLHVKNNCAKGLFKWKKLRKNCSHFPNFSYAHLQSYFIALLPITFVVLYAPLFVLSVQR